MFQLQAVSKILQSGGSAAPFLPQVRLHVIPSALALLPQIGANLLRKAELKVCETANKNTRETLEAHNEGHRQEAHRRERCQQSYHRTVIATKNG